MLNLLRQLRDILDRRERRRALVLLALSLIVGFFESTRVASIAPFIAVLADPDIVQTNQYLSAVYDWLGFRSANAFMFLLGLAIVVVTVVSLGLSALSTWATARFALRASYSLAMRLFEGYLYRPYDWFLKRHSAHLGTAVLSEVGQVIGGALMPAMQVVTQGALAVSLVILLLLVDPLLAVIVTSLLAGAYLLVLSVASQYLLRIGEDRRLANLELYQVSAEAFGAAKDVKAMGLEQAFVERFAPPGRRFVRAGIAGAVIGAMPQYALQAIALAVILVIVWYQVIVHDNPAQAIPVIALYALAGSRLMPALQAVYRAISALRFAKPALDAVHKDLVELPADGTGPDPSVPVPLGLRQRLELRDIGFTYAGATAPSLAGVSLTIPSRSTIGVVGSTGAGKTTLVDVILGLLEPQSGEIRVDGTTVTSANRRAWQRSVGYVPQHIFLADDTVAGNIAFGVAPEAIDMGAVERAAQIADLHEFVTGELADGYATSVGERGVRLSGGQRQRIGIARALYRDPDLLILDEGTSALDNVTERAVMDAVRNLAHRKTIILIAHRLTTVRSCDIIVVLDHGRLVSIGRYEDLIERDARFREMASDLSSDGAVA